MDVSIELCSSEVPGGFRTAFLKVGDSTSLAGGVFRAISPTAREYAGYLVLELTGQASGVFRAISIAAKSRTDDVAKNACTRGAIRVFIAHLVQFAGILAGPVDRILRRNSHIADKPRGGTETGRIFVVRARGTLATHERHYRQSD
jgi:hypothetical protein